MARHEHLPKELKHLAWLSLDDADGQEGDGESRD
jgi:tRNA-splicing ligase RtcB